MTERISQDFSRFLKISQNFSSFLRAKKPKQKSKRKISQSKEMTERAIFMAVLSRISMPYDFQLKY